MNFIAYKTPFEKPSLYEVGSPEKRISSPLSFIVSPFDPEKSFLYYPVKRKIETFPDKLFLKNNDFLVMTRKEYENYIRKIKSYIDGNDEKKIVASRRLRIFTEVCNGKRLKSLFDNLCEIYPEAYVFTISTSELGTWIGASPELLLGKEGQRLYTMALAGTRPSGQQDTCIKASILPWDHKNLKEHRIVINYILDIFDSFGIHMSYGPLITHTAGPVEHLKTEIKGKFTEESWEFEKIVNLLKCLSPTPALAGYPRNTAIDIIRNCEGDRQLYGGFLGLVAEGDFTFNVILRCACLEPAGKAVLFAGGGITAHSEPDSEWEETERKLGTLLSYLQTPFASDM